MEVLIQFLKNSPVIILGMFIITVLSGIITIIVGWKRLRDDILLKKVTVPVYAYLVVLFSIALASIFWPAIENVPKGLATIKGESFGVQRIFVDGKRFVNCKFTKTELVYRGEAGTSLEDCTFEKIGITFEGAAASTVKALTGLYADRRFRPLIENTLNAIKEGKLPKATPPSDAAGEPQF
jgi:hypothetical protein